TFGVVEATGTMRRSIAVEAGTGNSHRTSVEEASALICKISGQDAFDQGQHTTIPDAAPPYVKNQATVTQGESLKGEGSSRLDLQDAEQRGAGVPLDDGVFCGLACDAQITSNHREAIGIRGSPIVDRSQGISAAS